MDEVSWDGVGWGRVGRGRGRLEVQLAIASDQPVGMLLCDAALDAPVAQADMTVDGTARKHTGRLGGRNVGAGSHEVFIGTVGGSEDGPISGNLARGFGRANKNFWRGQLVAHAKYIRRLGVVFIQ